MPTPIEEPKDNQEAYVYRPVHPFQFDKKRLPKSQVFSLRPDETGLSVYDASVVSPRGTLQAFVDDTTAMLRDNDEAVQSLAQKRLDQFPDVETMVAKGWSIVKIPVSEIQARGFQLTGTEPGGHLEIVGEQALFEEHELAFVDLVEKAVAPLLTQEECLAS